MVPHIVDLYWSMTEHNLDYANLFFQSLERISIYLRTPEGKDNITLCNLLQFMASAISTLPVSNELQICTATTLNQSSTHEYFIDSLSCVVLHCGASFVKFCSQVPLSNEVEIHIISLPNLCTLQFNNPLITLCLTPSCSLHSFLHPSQSVFLKETLLQNG